MEFRRGREHIAKANEPRKTGDFRPFLSTFFWADDQDTKYLWILNPIDDIPMVKMLKPWVTQGRPEYVVSRQDPVHGESHDEIEDKWGYGPQELNVCVAVSLTPTFEVVRGRKRPTGFEVETRTFERRIRDAKGELTDQREEVTVPEIGLIAQSPANFFNHVSSADANVAPIHEKPARITRVGKDTNTEYEVEIFEEKDIDPANLFEFLENLNYLTSEEITELQDAIADLSVEEASVEIGTAILNKRLNELASDEFYDEVAGNIDTVARFPSKKYLEKNKGKSKSKDSEEAKPRPERPRRPSQVKKEEPEPEAKDEPAEEKPARKARTVTKGSSVKERLDSLRAEAEAKASAA